MECGDFRPDQRIGFAMHSKRMIDNPFLRYRNLVSPFLFVDLLGFSCFLLRSFLTLAFSSTFNNHFDLLIYSLYPSHRSN